ncbi:unnamed protein product [Amoebophrya sp. A25]|nr:unnamed protein product [Amoebophrya sp. A25]|eukprot:GSA25T00020562001.1
MKLKMFQHLRFSCLMGGATASLGAHAAAAWSSAPPDALHARGELELLNIFPLVRDVPLSEISTEGALYVLRSFADQPLVLRSNKIAAQIDSTKDSKDKTLTKKQNAHKWFSLDIGGELALRMQTSLPKPPVFATNVSSGEDEDSETNFLAYQTPLEQATSIKQLVARVANEPETFWEPEIVTSPTATGSLLHSAITGGNVVLVQEILDIVAGVEDEDHMVEVEKAACRSRTSSSGDCSSFSTATLLSSAREESSRNGTSTTAAPCCGPTANTFLRRYSPGRASAPPGGVNMDVTSVWRGHEQGRVAALGDSGHGRKQRRIEEEMFSTQQSSTTSTGHAILPHLLSTIDPYADVIEPITTAADVDAETPNIDEVMALLLTRYLNREKRPTLGDELMGSGVSTVLMHALQACSNYWQTKLDEINEEEEKEEEEVVGQSSSTSPNDADGEGEDEDQVDDEKSAGSSGSSGKMQKFVDHYGFQSGTEAEGEDDDNNKGKHTGEKDGDVVYFPDTAASTMCTLMLNELMFRGADIFRLTGNVEKREPPAQMNALHFAISKPVLAPEVLEMLLQGARDRHLAQGGNQAEWMEKINRATPRDDGLLSPLHMAAQSSDIDGIELLYQYGADPLARDVEGKTALFHAENAEMAKALVWEATRASLLPPRSERVKEKYFNLPEGMEAMTYVEGEDHASTRPNTKFDADLVKKMLFATDETGATVLSHAVTTMADIVDEAPRGKKRPPTREVEREAGETTKELLETLIKFAAAADGRKFEADIVNFREGSFGKTALFRAAEQQKWGIYKLLAETYHANDLLGDGQGHVPRQMRRAFKVLLLNNSGKCASSAGAGRSTSRMPNNAATTTSMEALVSPLSSDSESMDFEQADEEEEEEKAMKSSSESMS